MANEEAVDVNHPIFKENYTEEDKETLTIIIETLKRKVTCDICSGKGHQGYNCGTKTVIDTAVKSIPGVRKCWWDIKLAKKHAIPNLDKHSPPKKIEYMSN